MEFLKLDSSLGERKKLAQELGYAGALDGSAEMNTWLHKQVMTKVAESAGQDLGKPQNVEVKRRWPAIASRITRRFGRQSDPELPRHEEYFF